MGKLNMRARDLFVLAGVVGVGRRRAAGGVETLRHNADETLRSPRGRRRGRADLVCHEWHGGFQILDSRIADNQKDSARNSSIVQITCGYVTLGTPTDTSPPAQVHPSSLFAL